jgi:NAD(P)-dependent dehydrogenase (short-subunit alcohol dehydrogenase family)
VPCWRLPLELWDQLHIGLRSHYVACVLAVPLMLARGEELIVNVSSVGAVRYLYGNAYGQPLSSSFKWLLPGLTRLVAARPETVWRKWNRWMGPASPQALSSL